MFGNLLQQLYNVADIWVVGRYLGADALAAVGSSYTLIDTKCLHGIFFDRNDRTCVARNQSITSLHIVSNSSDRHYWNLDVSTDRVVFGGHHRNFILF